MEVRGFGGEFKLACIGGFLVKARGVVLRRPLGAGCGGDFSSVEMTVAVVFLEATRFLLLLFLIGDGV